jgi:hypothetical protein
MSGLAAVLAHRKDPGIYLWHGHFRDDDVRHSVEHAGWHYAHVDGWHGETKAEFLRAVGEALGFSAEDVADVESHGFDALADRLGDVVAGDSEGWVLLWDGWGPFARHDERAFSVSLSVLGGRVNADRGGPFVVVLRGEGPEVRGVPSLD